MTSRGPVAAARLAVACALALVASVALAGPDDAFEPGSVRAQVEAAIKAGDEPKALAVLDGLLADATPRVRARHVEAAKAAMDLLPAETADPRAARFLAEALRIDRGQAGGAWDLAQELRKELIRRVAVEDGVRFLERLTEIYPDVPLYRHNLAMLLLDGGRRDAARAQLEVNFRMAPSDTWAGFTLALIAEEDGDIAGAVAIYDRLVNAKPNEMRARLLKVRLLGLTDRAAARAALDEAVRAAESAPSESVRADFLEQCAAERDVLDQAEKRRTAVAALSGRIGAFTWTAIAAWIALIGAALWCTQSGPARRDAPRN